ncbi:MAG: aspartate aminotransferase family protein [Candidatus Hodarchaeota archaeon]
MFLKNELETFVKARVKSQELWKRSKVLPGGVSHNIRNLSLPLVDAFPVFIRSANGAHLYDVDGIEYTDYWMGHFAMILGHNHPVIQKVLQEELLNGWHFGTTHENQVKLAETLIRDNPSIEKVRFCTSGTESTMYATRLARAYTGKRLVLKAKMGWHGPNDTLFYNVKAPFTGEESPGILPEDQAGVITFNPYNYDATQKLIQTYANDLAAVIIEPVLGGGGGFALDMEFLKLLREETEKHDILLIFDEVITGYRFLYGLFQNDIKIFPDITTMGKIIGGGLPIGLVGGKDEIIEQANPQIKNRVWIGGGTFSANPLSMVAGLSTLKLLENMDQEYKNLNQDGMELQTKLNNFFNEEKVNLVTTGYKSILFLHVTTKFLEDPNPNEIVKHSDNKKEAYLSLTLLNRNITGMHGVGALSLVHTSDHIQKLYDAIIEVAPPISKAEIV